MAHRHEQPAGEPRPGPAWHTLGREAVVEQLQSHPTRGLTPEEAQGRLEQHGRNVLETRGRRPWPTMLAAQFTDFMIIVLLAAAVIAGFVGEPQDSIAIVVIVVLNAVIGFTQEFRAEKAMAALRKMAAHKARVVRGGDVSVIDADQLVPGDIVWLEAGDVVPADVRLVEAARLQTEEAALTGESVPVEKGTAPHADPEAPLGDRTGMAYKGTLVTLGRGRGVVVATGMRTELGHIATLLSADESRTPLQKRLAHFGRRLAMAVLAICAILFVVGWLRGEPALNMFLTAVSLAVAAIPEALPAVVTISLALGAARMVKRKALIRRLPAVETLGSVTYICADKTGTLTENRMQVETIYADGVLCQGVPADGPGWRELGRVIALCNDARADADGTLTGDPTETALLAALPPDAVAAWAKTHPRLGEIPFDASRARMSTFHRDETGVLMLTKGAPESLLPRCRSQCSAAGETAPDPALEQLAERLAAGGQRVLAFAMKRLPELPAGLDPDDTERDLVFVGLAGLMDPPRPEAAPAVAACKAAGITPVMITGDHPATAKAVAARLGIIEPGARVITGRELAGLSPEALATELPQVRVYARINPEQKIRIVEALQDAGEFVAMTGDGVNDAPALRRADIGVAMGKIGTDVAREAAAMTLLDDQFATIVAAVREGRRIFDNIRKFVKYTMTSNSGEIWTLFLAPFLGLPIPLLPIHILWINLVTDGLPGLALAVEPEERGIMQRRPRPPGESIFAHGMWQHILWVGLLMGGISLMTQALALRSADAHWQSMVFTVLTLSQMGHVLAIRSERESLFRSGLLSNTPLLLAVLLTFALQMAVLYVPWLQPIFKTEALSLAELAFCLLASSVVFIAVEAEKFLLRRGWL
ncbi:MAG: cation-translocating P-type ATPase, partial [Gammaproteobacteria bacterium]|nr:cation-translocating P-type ATPase [Gammaproteobacteria bacterium]